MDAEEESGERDEFAKWNWKKHGAV
jgi:hypothetical protein